MYIRRALHRYAQRDYVRLLDLPRRPPTRALGEHRRDDGRVLARPVLSQPKVLLLAVRAVLTGVMPRGWPVDGSSAFRDPPASSRSGVAMLLTGEWGATILLGGG